MPKKKIWAEKKTKIGFFICVCRQTLFTHTWRGWQNRKQSKLLNFRLFFQPTAQAGVFREKELCASDSCAISFAGGLQGEQRGGWKADYLKTISATDRLVVQKFSIFLSNTCSRFMQLPWNCGKFSRKILFVKLMVYEIWNFQTLGQFLFVILLILMNVGLIVELRLQKFIRFNFKFEPSSNNMIIKAFLRF